jgi:hypothetical protein
LGAGADHDALDPLAEIHLLLEPFGRASLREELGAVGNDRGP